MAGFVENDRVFKASFILEEALARGALRREESNVEEAVAGKAGEGERGRGSRYARCGGHRKTALTALAHEAEARIADCGHTGVRDEGDALASLNPVGQHTGHMFLVLLAVGE